MVNEKVFLGFYNMLADEDKQDVLAFLFKRVNNTVLKKERVSLQIEEVQEAKPAKPAETVVPRNKAKPWTVFGVTYPSGAKACAAHHFSYTQVKYRTKDRDISMPQALEELVRERDAAEPVPETSGHYIAKDFDEIKPVSLTIGGNNV